MQMYNAGILTTIAGAFFVTFVVIICWGKMVEDFGPVGGMLCAAIIVGTFWIMNHKLPGWGIAPDQYVHPDGGAMQYGLILQGARAAAPWIDMGWAIGMGLWVCGLFDAKKGERLELAVESTSRVGAVILGGIIGGAIVGLNTYVSNNSLFGTFDKAIEALPK